MLILLITTLILGAGAFAYYHIKGFLQRQVDLKKVVARKQKDREESVAWALTEAAKVPAETRQQIISKNFQQLREGLQSGEWKAVDVVRAYLGNIVEANKKVNALCVFINESVAWAEELDKKAEDSSYEKPHFFGMPTSLKECVPIKGYDQTRGFLQDCYKPTQEDSVLVQQMKFLGFLPICQTNVPQSLLAFCCSNPVYGTTNHPLSKDRTPGGSSGGESAIIAAGGSIFGIGGDVGGSVRIPAHFTGIAAFKPSHTRFSHRGVCGSVPGRPMINSNDGPMAQDAQTIIDFLKQVGVIIDQIQIWKDTFQSKLDPYVPPVLWDEEPLKQENKFTIGYYTDDGFFTAHPAIQRAVLESKRRLEAQGHRLVPFKPPTMGRVMNHFVRAVSVDGGRFLLGKMFYDIVEPLLYNQVMLFAIPIWVQRLAFYPMQFLFPRFAMIMTAPTTQTHELRATYGSIELYREAFVEQMRVQGIDALLCPPHAMIAPAHDIPSKCFATVSYAAVFNLLDFGAGVVKVTEVTDADEKALQDEYPDTDAWYRIVKSACKNSVGYPVGVQVASPPFREEIALRIMSDIESFKESN